MSVTSTVSAAATEARDRWAPDGPAPDAGPIQRAAQVGTIIAVVIIGVVALIGLLVFDQVRNAIPEAALEDDEGAQNDFGAAVESIMEGFGGAMELIPVVLLVLIAALVIGVVQRMRQTNGGAM